MAAPAKTLLVLTLVGGLMGIRTAAGQESSPLGRADVVVIAGQDGNDRSVAPGSILTATFRFANLSDTPRQLEVEIGAPSTWNVRFPVGRITVASRDTVAKFVVVRVPSNAAAGSYRLAAVATDLADNRSYHGALGVVVGTRCRLALEASSQARYVTAGGELIVLGAIRNESNVPLNVTLDARAATGLEVALDTTVFHLQPGQAGSFSVLTVVPAAVEAKIRRSVIIRAEAAECASESVTTTIGFDVIPNSQTPSGKKSSIPGLVTAHAVGGNRGVGGQLELAAAGHLDELQKHRFGIHFRVPDQRRSARFGQRGLLQASYENPYWSVTVGDTKFGFSTLTRVPGLGRGLTIEGRGGPVKGSGFYERHRVGFPVKSRAGVLLSFAVSDRASIGATYLRQTGLDKGEGITLLGQISPIDEANISVEVGDAVSGVNRTAAYAVELSGKHRRLLQYSGRYVHAGPGFPGQYSDFDFRQGSLTLRPTEWLFLQSSVKVETQSFDAAHGAGLFQRRNEVMRLGVGWRHDATAKHQSAAVYAGLRRRVLAGHTGESAIQRHLGVELRTTRSSISLASEARAGRYEDRLLGISEPFVRLRVGSQVSGSSGTTSLSVEWLKGYTVDRPVGGSVLGARLTLKSEIVRNTDVRLDAFVSRDEFWPGGMYHLINAKATRRLKNGIEVATQLQYTSVGTSAGERFVDGGLSISVPLHLPNPIYVPARRFGGRVVDSESGEPVRGVHVQLGDQHSLTNAEGRFEVRSPEIGEHLLRIDVSTLGVGYVPLVEVPHPVTVTREGTREIEIEVARAATLVGRLEIAEDGRLQSAYDENGGFPGSAVIEIRDAVGRYRTVNNYAGKFSIRHIRPGDYQAVVVYAKLPEHYRIEHESYAFSVAPGQQGELVIRVVPERRPIRIITKGKLSLNRPTPVQVDEIQPESDDVVEATCPRMRPAAEVTHRVIESESFSLLALRYYGDPSLWPVVWLRNRELTDNPDFVGAGEVVTVPSTAKQLTRTRKTFTHVAERSDTWQSLAIRYLGSADLWPLLWDGNKNKGTRTAPEPGSRLAIPGIRLRPTPPECLK